MYIERLDVLPCTKSVSELKISSPDTRAVSNIFTRFDLSVTFPCGVTCLYGADKQIGCNT